MKTIGLIGGMSWESSAEYYRLINTLVKERLGGFHSAKCVMVSVDFAENETLHRENRLSKLRDRDPGPRLHCHIVDNAGAGIWGEPR